MESVQTPQPNTDGLQTTVKLRNGDLLAIRPLRQADTSALTAYFAGLSEQTVNWYRPHAFDAETVKRICQETGRPEILRIIALPASDESKIVAYFILQWGVREQDAKRLATFGTTLNEDTDCTLAPSVSDTYQNAGLGSAVLKEAFRLARAAGKKRMVLWSGVNKDNDRAVHFYEKFGFRIVNAAEKDAKNHQMIADLTPKENQS